MKSEHTYIRTLTYAQTFTYESCYIAMWQIAFASVELSGSRFPRFPCRDPGSCVKPARCGKGGKGGPPVWQKDACLALHAGIAWSYHNIGKCLSGQTGRYRATHLSICPHVHMCTHPRGYVHTNGSRRCPYRHISMCAHGYMPSSLSTYLQMQPFYRCVDR